MSAEKTPYGVEALTRSHFTALRQRLELTHRGLHRNSKDERTVTTACLQPGRREWSRKSNRPTYKDRHARNSSWPGELISITGRIHLRRLAFSPSTFPCSRAADHTFSLMWIDSVWTTTGSCSVLR